uniref:Uncharacterized protein n=1 Tax=Oryza glumipatula TaxID=40148 RepID=A0A0D9ZLV0_9ORYZ
MGIGLVEENRIVSMSEYKVASIVILSEFDVHAVVGGNRPFHMRDIRVTVESEGAFVINFKGVRGSPMVCAICIRKTVAIAEQVLDRQADQLRSVSQKYENANKLWAAAISNYENKIKAMKQEQTLLSLEAHGRANTVPELSKMVGAVQALGYIHQIDVEMKLCNLNR